MSLRRGDFALVYFPHSDLRTVKLRPVLVVQGPEEPNTGLLQIIVAMVVQQQFGPHRTSQGWAGLETDAVLPEETFERENWYADPA